MFVSACASAESAQPEVAIHDASAIADRDLLGQNWTGSGRYTLHEAASAYSASGDYQVFAARISAPESDNMVLFWRAEGENVSDGAVVGDARTRRFSVWGNSVSVGSLADVLVSEARASAEGQAVLAAVSS